MSINTNCDSCDFCNSCDYCHYSSYQQKPYGVFNTQITKEEYRNITIPSLKLEFDKDKYFDTCYKTAFKKAWCKANEELKQQFFDLPNFDWEIFTKITGVEKEIEDIVT